jgi:hypothetical protein
MKDEGTTFTVKRILRLALLALILHPSTFILSARAQSDTTKADTAGFHMTKSPLEAVLLSAVIPGAGQVYLHQTWKLPIIWGIGGAFFYGAYIQNFRYHFMQDSINNAMARYHVDPEHRVADSLWSVVYAGSREFYRDDRDKWWIYVGLTYIANILDAYIAANLYDFDVSNPDGSVTAPIGTYYDPSRRQFGLSLRIKY